ncbi:hypothetical protein F5X97DRAFT_175879 [Nemania serpens]|nr:hypothetical protein F5X97DRAFT_175879 [Nemania serpens]
MFLVYLAHPLQCVRTLLFPPLHPASSPVYAAVISLGLPTRKAKNNYVALPPPFLLFSDFLIIFLWRVAGGGGGGGVQELVVLFLFYFILFVFAVLCCVVLCCVVLCCDVVLPSFCISQGSSRYPLKPSQTWRKREIEREREKD